MEIHVYYKETCFRAFGMNSKPLPLRVVQETSNRGQHKMLEPIHGQHTGYACMHCLAMCICKHSHHQGQTTDSDILTDRVCLSVSVLGTLNCVCHQTWSSSSIITTLTGPVWKLLTEMITFSHQFWQIHAFIIQRYHGDIHMHTCIHMHWTRAIWDQTLILLGLYRLKWTYHKLSQLLNAPLWYV